MGHREGLCSLTSNTNTFFKIIEVYICRFHKVRRLPKIKRPFRYHEGRNLIIISDLRLQIRDLRKHIEQFIDLTELEALMSWKMPLFESQLLIRKFHRI